MKTLRYVTVLFLSNVLLYSFAHRAKLKAANNEEETRAPTIRSIDLRCLDPSSRAHVLSGLKKLLPRRDPKQFIGLQDWFLFETQRESGPGPVILLEVAQPTHQPDDPTILMSVFSSDRSKLMSFTRFGAGWRMIVTAVSAIEHNTDKGYSPAIQISAKYAISGGAGTRQYYALVDGSPAVIRLEDSEGRPVRNNYADDHIIGPPAPDRTLLQWEHILAGGEDPDAVLAALVWVGGKHWDPKKRQPAGVVLENLQEARLAHNVRSRPSVQWIIRKLTRSPDRWIREASELVLTGGDVTK